MSDPMDCSPPGSYVQGISQARILSGLTFPSPQDLRDPGIEPGSPTLVGGFLTTELPKKSVFKHTSILNDNYYFCYSGLFNLFIYTFVKCLFIFLNWSTVDLQYHVNFKYTAKRFSYMYKCISIYLSIYLWGFPGRASGKEPACQCKWCKRCSFHPQVVKIPWKRAWQSTPVFLPRESYGQRSLAGYSNRVTKSQIWLRWLSTHIYIYVFFFNSIPLVYYKILNRAPCAIQKDLVNFIYGSVCLLIL